jgi:unsaturated chondroitin disaccharide hydrolase
MAVSAGADAVVLAEALERALAGIRRTIPRLGSDRPRIGLPDLTYERCGDNDWVDSFWSGQLWLAYGETGDPVFLEAARRQRPYFAERLGRPESHTHDLGFLYTLSVVADHKLTGDPEARRLGLLAADALTKRFNPAGRFIQAWNAGPRTPPELRERLRGKIIVDCMENLALLCWAAEASGEDRYREIAVAHAETSVRYLVRDDASTYHTYDFDPESGRPLGGSTHQGYADESCWSRGQAWAIHGFAQLHAYTGLPLFLATARRLADYAVAELPADKVPYWDYRLPPEAPRYRDSSAAAITAAGLFLLADRLEGDEAAAAYREVAQAMLAALSADYTTTDTPGAEGLLRHGASHVKIGLADTMLPYGDYFYVEGLLRGLGRRQFAW